MATNRYTPPRVTSPIKTTTKPIAPAPAKPAAKPATPVTPSKTTPNTPIKPVVIDPQEVKNIEMGYHKVIVLQRVFWLPFSPLMLYWIIPFIVCLFFVRLSVVPVFLLLVIFASTLQWPGFFSRFVFLIPFLPLIMVSLLFAGGYGAIWYFVIRAPTPQMQPSSIFIQDFTLLTSDEQNSVTGFKNGVHSWTLNGNHTGAIISDLVINGQTLGIKVVFDDQSALYLAYSDIISFVSNDTYTATIPVRTLGPITVMDSTVSSYSITYDRITDHFTMTRT